MGVKVGFKALLPLLVIALLFVSIFSPVVEASIAYGPTKYLGDWYLSPKTGIVNGSGSIVNGSKPDNTPRTGNANPSIIYTGQYQFPGNDNRGPVFDDYKRLMGRYRPDMSFDNDGNVHFNAKNGRDDAGSGLVFKFLDKYVKTDNFTITAPHGNYTLCLRNGDGTGKYVKNGTIFYVRLNGKDVFTPLDSSLTNQVLKKNVTVSENNTLEVFAVGLPGSYLTLWLEDESPDIVLTSPLDDSVSNGTITLVGYTTDAMVKNVTIRQSNNATITTVPVVNGNFSARLQVKMPVRLNVSARDRTGTLRYTLLSLDGDMLPENAELKMGFDPLNPDSDSTLTPANEAENGVLDGYEIFNAQSGETLPAFVKYRIGADPFKMDTDNDGLTDYFELMGLGLLTNVSSTDSDGDGIPDANEDTDNDTLTNVQEQSWGTDPLVGDTDGDGLKDGYEVNVSHTSPLSVDSDNDGLTDKSEAELGTNPNNPDSNGNGVPDGMETYTTTASNEKLGVTVSVTGVGDMSRQVTMGREVSEYYTNYTYDNVSALVSPLVNISVNGSYDHMIITMKYDPALVENPANCSLCYYNESLGLYIPVESYYDEVNHTISANVTHSSLWGIFDTNILGSIYTAANNFNKAIEGYMSNAVDIAKSYVEDTASKTWGLIRNYIPGSDGTISIEETVKPSYSGSTPSNKPPPAPTPTPTPTPVPDLTPVPIPTGLSSLNILHVTDNRNSQVKWFGNGYSYPSGVYRIIASGWHTAWSPRPSTISYTDGGVELVTWPAWYGNSLRFRSNTIDNYIGDLRTGPGLLKLMHQGGGIGVWYWDSRYDDNSMDATFALQYTGELPVNAPDTDRDGLPDWVETYGFADQKGNAYHTKPNNPDTDGDGLKDGQEAGTWHIYNGIRYFQVKSDPTKKDTDGDYLDDKKELTLGTNSWSVDSDQDGAIDPFDPLPTSYNRIAVSQNILEEVRIMQIGAAYREAGMEGGRYHYMVGDRVSNSPFYKLGSSMYQQVPGWVAEIKKIYGYHTWSWMNL